MTSQVRHLALVSKYVSFIQLNNTTQFYSINFFMSESQPNSVGMLNIVVNESLVSDSVISSSQGVGCVVMSQPALVSE